MSGESMFDPDAGSLAVPDRTFDTLIAIRRDSEQHVHPSHLHHVRLLHDLGVITESGVHRVLLDALSAVAARQTELNLRVSTAQETCVRQAWLLGDAVGWVTSTGGGVEFRSGRVDRIPEVLSAMIELGPRGNSDELLASRGGGGGEDGVGVGPSQNAFAISRRVFDAILAGAEPNRREGARFVASRAPTALAAWAEDLVADRWRSWHFEMKWRQGPAHEGRAVIGLDLPSGYLVAEPLDETLVEITTIRAALVWRRLLRLLPPVEALQPQPDGRQRGARPPF